MERLGAAPRCCIRCKSCLSALRVWQRCVFGVQSPRAFRSPNAHAPHAGRDDRCKSLVAIISLPNKLPYHHLTSSPQCLFSNGGWTWLDVRSELENDEVGPLTLSCTTRMPGTMAGAGALQIVEFTCRIASEHCHQGWNACYCPRLQWPTRAPNRTMHPALQVHFTNATLTVPTFACFHVIASGWQGEGQRQRALRAPEARVQPGDPGARHEEGGAGAGAEVGMRMGRGVNGMGQAWQGQVGRGI